MNGLVFVGLEQAENALQATARKAPIKMGMALS